MSRFERLLIAPTPAELGEALTEAAMAASEGARARTLLPWAPAHTEALIRDIAMAPEGRREFEGGSESEGPTSGSKTRSVVAACWWTDPLGGKHVRLGGWRRGRRRNWAGWGRAAPPATTAPRRACPGTPPTSRPAPGTSRVRSRGRPSRSCRTAGRWSWAGSHRACRGAASGTWRQEPPGASWATLRPWPCRLTGLLATPVFDEIVLVSPADGTRRRTLQMQVGNDRIHTLAFSPDGSLLAVLCHHRLELWDLATCARRAVVLEVPGATSFQPRGVAFSPDGGTLAVSPTQQSPLLLWDVAFGAHRGLQVPVSQLYCGGTVAFSPDGRTLAAITADHRWHVHMLDLAGRVLAEPDFPARDLAFSPDGRALASAGYDGSLGLFGVDGRPLGVYSWHVGGVTAVAFSPDGRWLAASSTDGTVKLWPAAALLAGDTD